MAEFAMTHPADCFICRKHRGEEPLPGGLIYSDRLLFASHAALQKGGKVYLGWCVIEPVRHVEGLGDLTDAEAEALGRLAARLSRTLKEELQAEHIYAFVLGHHVPHLHLHLIARYAGTPREYWGVNIDEWPDAPKGDEVKISALVGRLRTRLSVC